MNDTATPAPAAPDAAPAPQPAQQSVPIDNSSGRAPNPVERSSPAQPQQKEMKLDEPVSINDAIRKADEKVTARRAEKEAAEKAPKAPEPKTEAKPAKEAEPKPERARAEDGKFAPSESAQKAAKNFKEPPARFLENAKAEWDSIPEWTRGEIHRAFQNNEEGINKHKAEAEKHRAEAEKYKADAEAYNDIRPYAERAQKSGTKLTAALESYTGIEDMLRQNPLAGLDRICRNIGTTLQQVAEHVLGQPPEQRDAQKDQMIQQLYAKIGELEKKTNTVTETIEQQRTESVLRVIEDFKTKPEHARFDELENDITMFLETGRAKTLQEAYQLAERLNPAADASNLEPLTAANPEQLTAARPAPLNPAGTKSISGAPATGSNPEQRKRKGPPPSIKESLERAKQRAGGSR